MTRKMVNSFGLKRLNQGVTEINNSVFEDERLSWKAKGLLACLLSKKDNWKINKKELENISKDGRDSITNAINELEKYGYIINVEG